MSSNPDWELQISLPRICGKLINIFLLIYKITAVLVHDVTLADGLCHSTEATSHLILIGIVRVLFCFPTKNS